MSKHTPGPWRAEVLETLTDASGGEFRRYTVRTADDEDPSWICDIRDFAPREAEANARLIAAAPSMHAVLGKLITIMEGDPSSFGALLDEAAEVWSAALRTGATG
jgi:hypothetical protein